MSVNPAHLQHLLRQHAGDLAAPAFVGGGFWSKVKSAAAAVGGLASRAYNTVAKPVVNYIAPTVRQAVDRSVLAATDSALTALERGNYSNIGRSAIAGGRQALNTDRLRRDVVGDIRKQLLIAPRPKF